MIIQKLIGTICLSVLLCCTAGAQEDHDDHAGHDEHGHEGGEVEVVELSTEELAEFGVVLDTAGRGFIRNEIVVPGEIAVNGDRLAHIVPRFPGIVKEVRKSIGDRVATGDVLAVIESNEGLTPYPMKAMLDGVVIDKHVTIGEVHSGSTPAFVIADLDTVWVNLSVYQMHLPYVRVGQPVAVTADHGLTTQGGTISYLSPIVDEHTRTATARVVLDNRSGEWRPGLLVEGRISVDTYEAPVVVPTTALQRLEGDDVVFVRTDHGFEPLPVETGRSDQDFVEILHGLEAGQEFVSRGGFTIKAEMQKGSFKGGHAH